MIESQLFQMYNLKEMTLSAEFFLSCSILQLTFYAVGTAYQRKKGFVVLSKQLHNIFFLTILFALVLLLNENTFSVNVLASNHSIVNDHLSFVAKVSLCLALLSFLLIIKTNSQDELIYHHFEYLTLITVSTLGLMLLCSANDLVTAYLSIELHSIAFYLMASFKKNSSYSIESGLKYFITGALSSAFFLFGSALVYGCLGSFSFTDFEVLFPLWNFIDLSSYSLAPSNTTLSAEYVSALTFVTHSDTIHLADPFEHPYSNNGLNCYELPSNSFYISNLIFFEKHLNTCLFSEEQVLFTNPSSISKPLFLLLNTVNSFTHLSNLLPMFLTSGGLNNSLIYLGLLLIFISLLIKLALAPFHLWSLDVYEGSPNSTTVFFAIVPKIALFVLLVRLYYLSFYNQLSSDYLFYFLVIALLSVIVGSVGGLEQRKIKTLFAYSSISHTGYLFLAFVVNTFTSLQLMLYYLVIYMISGLCFWTAYLLIKPYKKMYPEKHSKELADFILLRDSNPMIAAILAITLFSTAGIPPLIGFLTKVGVFLVIIQSSAYFVATVGILSSVVSTFYYIRFIKILYFENVLIGRLYSPITSNNTLLLSLLTLSLIALSINPTLVYLIFFKTCLLVIT